MVQFNLPFTFFTGMPIFDYNDYNENLKSPIKQIKRQRKGKYKEWKKSGTTLSFKQWRRENIRRNNGSK